MHTQKELEKSNILASFYKYRPASSVLSAVILRKIMMDTVVYLHEEDTTTVFMVKVVKYHDVLCIPIFIIIIIIIQPNCSGFMLLEICFI